MGLAKRMVSAEKRKVFEVGGEDYSKGYFEAENKKEAEKRAGYKSISTVYYDDVAPGSDRAKQLGVSFKKSTLTAASDKFRKRFI